MKEDSVGKVLSTDLTDRDKLTEALTNVFLGGVGSLYDPELVARVEKESGGLTPREVVANVTNKIRFASPRERLKIAARSPALAGVIYELNGAEGHGGVEAEKNSPTARPVVMQGDTRGLAQRQGLHTPTMAEIIAQGNQRDPAAPYFDTNSDHMRVINPLEPHYDLSGDFPKLVNPLKPGPKISNLG